MSDYPLHDEMKARSAERRVVQEVIDTLAEKGIELCRWQEDGGHGGRDGSYEAIPETQDRLVALIMDIDYQAFQAEKDAMYEALTANG